MLGQLSKVSVHDCTCTCSCVQFHKHLHSHTCIYSILIYSCTCTHIHTFPYTHTPIHTCLITLTQTQHRAAQWSMNKVGSFLPLFVTRWREMASLSSPQSGCLSASFMDMRLTTRTSCGGGASCFHGDRLTDSYLIPFSINFFVHVCSQCK